jgi:hypothetical protein
MHPAGPHPDKNIVLAFSSSGGRFPIHLGIADWIESELVADGWVIAARIGTSGGAFAAVTRSRGIGSREWFEIAVPVGHHAHIGPSKKWRHAWNMLMYGGVLRSSSLISNSRDGLFVQGGGWTEEGQPAGTPCYTVAWSITSNTEVVFPVDLGNVAEVVVASSSIPGVISPTEIRNGDLSPEIQRKLRVEDHPEEFSAFVDGAVSTPVPIDTAFDLPEVKDRIDQGRQVAVLGISLDPAEVRYRPDGLVGSALSGGVFYKKILSGCFAALKSATVEDMEDAMDVGTCAMLNVSTGPFSEYAAKFDVTVEEAATMWQYGFDCAQDLCSIGWGANGSLTLLEHLDTLVG